MSHSIASSLKGLVIRGGCAPRRIAAGAFRGLYMHLDLSSQAQYALGLHEREVHSWLRRLSAGVRTAVDVGADQGEYALYFTQCAGIARVIAYEPSTESLPRFLANLELNRIPLDRVDLRSQYVGAAGTNTSPLDELTARIEYPVFVKVDVDGGELDVLRSAERLIAGGETRWVVETHSKALEESCQQFFLAHGMRTRVVPNAWWRAIVPELRPIPHNRWLVATAGNAL